MRFLMVVLFVSITSAGFAQHTIDCKLNIKASEKLNNQSFKLFRYSISNVSKQKDADKISKLLNLRVGDALYIHPDSLCKKFAPVLNYKEYRLKNVYIAVDSLNDPAYERINLKFEFSK